MELRKEELHETKAQRGFSRGMPRTRILAQDAQGSTIFSEQYDVDDFDDFEPEEGLGFGEQPGEVESRLQKGRNSVSRGDS